MKNSRVSVVILNWNGWEDTIECLESLYNINYYNYDVIVVDNNSEDDSVEKIKDYCSGSLKISSRFFEYKSDNKPIHVLELVKKESEPLKTIPQTFLDFPNNKKLILIENDKNYGYAEGNNIGIRYSFKFLNPDYIMILNNDTAVNKDFLLKLITFAENDEEIGIIGPKIYYYDNSRMINSAGGVIKWKSGIGVNLGIGKIDEGQFNTVNYVDCLLGACILIKSDVIKKIGLLDEKFFLLLEETDFRFRAKKAGYKIVFLPEAIIYHKEGISGQINPLILYYMYRNRLLFFKKHQAPLKVYLFTFYITLMTSINLIIYTLKRDFKSVKCIIKGHLDGLSYKS
jgi:GT2 family glycosyltransferase